MMGLLNLLVFSCLLILQAINQEDEFMRHKRLRLLYKIAYISMIVMSLFVAGMSVWLGGIAYLSPGLIILLTILSMAMFGSGLWLWLSEDRALNVTREKVDSP